TSCRDARASRRSPCAGSFLRPDRFGDRRGRWIDRDRDTALPLDDNERRTDTAPGLVEFDASTRKILGWPLRGIHRANGLCNLMAVGRAGRLKGLLEDPEIAVSR